MKIRTPGQVIRIGFAALAFNLVILACGSSMATDVERLIPAVRDSTGSGLTIEVSREGTRQTATPHLTLTDPTLQLFENLIAKKIARLTEKDFPAEATVAESLSRIGRTGAPQECSGQPPVTLSSLPPMPGEITFRSVRGFLRGLRSSWKEKTAPAVAAPVPELLLGMAVPSAR